MNTNSARPRRWASHICLYLMSALAAFAVAPTIDSDATDDTTVGAAYSYTITTDVDASPDAPTLYSVSGNPAWLTRSGNVLSGTPPTTGELKFDVFAENADGSDSQEVTLTVFASTNAPVFTSDTALNGTVGQPFTYTATTDNPPVSWTIAGTIPDGLSFSTTTGVLSGTPTTEGDYDILITGTNIHGDTGIGGVINIVIDPVTAPAITSDTEVNGFLSTPFSYTIVATNSPTSFSATGLPAFLTRSGNVISGTPTSTGVFKFDVSAANGDGLDTKEVTLTVTVDATAPVFTSSTSVNGTVGESFTYTATTDNPWVDWSISGDIPAGLSFNTTTGVLSGTPTTAGDYDVLITGTNIYGNTGLGGSVNILIAPVPVPVITSADSATGEVGQVFSYTITATNTPTSFGAQGLVAVPGLSLSVGGVISGTPTVFGVFPITLTAENNDGTSTPVELLLTINKAGGAVPVPTITSSATVNGKVGTALSYQIVADGNPATYSAPGLAAITGLSIDTTTGLISGTPSVAGTFNVTLRATNASGTGELAAQFIIVDDLPLEVTITSPGEDALAPVGERLSIDIEATDADGFIATVEVFVDGVSAGFASFVAPGQYRFELTPTTDNLGNTAITATATNNDGATDSDTVTIGVTPSTILVEFIVPTVAQNIVADETITFQTAVTSSASVLKVEYFADGVLIGESTDESSNYEFDIPFADPGVFEVTAIATDTNDVTSASSAAIIVTVTPRNALLRDEDFIIQTFLDLFNREPRARELADGLAALDGTVGARADYLTALLTSVTAENVEISTIIYRTMTGEWPDSAELNQALEDLLGTTTGGSTFNGTIFFGLNESFTFQLPAGAVVTASVAGDPSGGFELIDPTLSIFAPNGTLVAFNDDFNGLDPQITFTASIAGIYTFVVGEFGSNSSGDFILTIASSSIGGIGVVNPDALTQALVPEYEDRFSVLNTDNGFLTQIFENKHLGVIPTLLTERRLTSALVNDFGSNLTQYTTQFALDNEAGNFEGPDGNPLSTLLNYEFPNRPIDRVPYAHALAALLRSSPTDTAVENAYAQDLEDFVASLLASSDYYERFDGDTSTAGRVIQYMASFGVFDNPSVNVANLAPDADFDRDGATNEEEMDAGTDPTRRTGGSGSIFGTLLEFILSFIDAIRDLFSFGFLSSSAEVVGAGVAPKVAAAESIEKASVDGDSFTPVKDEAVQFSSLSEESELSPVVIEGYLVVSDSKGLSNEKTLIITYVQPVDFDQLFLIESSSDSIYWDLAKPISSEDVLASDQTGVDEGSERIEFRATFDNSSDECNFFKIGY